tara:strand:+ start:515 stop:736 length:222 start_codon:yes stop_codon:yes gene_type:complete
MKIHSIKFRIENPRSDEMMDALEKYNVYTEATDIKGQMLAVGTKEQLAAFCRGLWESKQSLLLLEFYENIQQL